MAQGYLDGQTGRFQNTPKNICYAENRLKMVIMEELILDMTENIVRNEENAGNQDFLLFPQCFQKALLFKGH